MRKRKLVATASVVLLAIVLSAYNASTAVTVGFYYSFDGTCHATDASPCMYLGTGCIKFIPEEASLKQLYREFNPITLECDYPLAYP